MASEVKRHRDEPRVGVVVSQDAPTLLPAAAAELLALLLDAHRNMTADPHPRRMEAA